MKGFVLNKFRGDQTLLGNAMEWLQERTGVPTTAIIPMIQHALPEEDTPHHRSTFRERQINIALLVYPYASNLEEFDPLIHEPGVNVVPIRDYASLDDYHAVLLPGSKNTAASLQHLRQTGLAAEISRTAQRGVMVMGVCGGLQMLGNAIHDPHQLESGGLGLGLLDLRTTLASQKTTRQRAVRWNGILIHGYEIHQGHTSAGTHAREEAAFHLALVPGDGQGSALFAALRPLAALAVESVQEYLKAVETARTLHRGSPREDTQDFLEAIHRIMTLERRGDEVHRSAKNLIALQQGSYGALFGFIECARNLEAATDALMHTALHLRDAVLGELVVQ